MRSPSPRAVRRTPGAVADAGGEVGRDDLSRLEAEVEDFRQTLHFILDKLTVPPDVTAPEPDE